MSKDTQFARQILLLTQTALQQGRIDYPGKTQIYDLEDLHETLREALEGIEKLCSELLVESPDLTALSDTIPVKVDPSLPANTIRFESGGKVYEERL